MTMTVPDAETAVHARASAICDVYSIISRSLWQNVLIKFSAVYSIKCSLYAGLIFMDGPDAMGVLVC